MLQEFPPVIDIRFGLCSIDFSTEKLQAVASSPVIFFSFFKQKKQHGAVKGEEIDMPGHGREIVDARQRRIKEEIAKHELEQDTEINKRIGDEIKNDVVAFKEVREPRGEWHDDRPLDTLQRL